MRKRDSARVCAHYGSRSIGLLAAVQHWCVRASGGEGGRWASVSSSPWCPLNTLLWDLSVKDAWREEIGAFKRWRGEKTFTSALCKQCNRQPAPCGFSNGLSDRDIQGQTCINSYLAFKPRGPDAGQVDGLILPRVQLHHDGICIHDLHHLYRRGQKENSVMQRKRKTERSTS